MSADDLEALASNLLAFLIAANGKATNLHGFPKQVGEPRRQNPRPSDATLEVFENCLRKLTEEERGHFERIIGKMLEVVTDPRGARPSP